jgi:hypothetical protein
MSTALVKMDWTEIGLGIGVEWPCLDCQGALCAGSWRRELGMVARLRGPHTTQTSETACPQAACGVGETRGFRFGL